MGDEQLAFSVISAMLARVHLAGRIDTLTPAQLDLVRAGLDAYKSLRSEISSSVPSFPLGLPAWRDDWIAQGARLDGTTLAIAVHRRGGDARQDIALPGWLGSNPAATVVYPAWGAVDVVPGVPDGPAAGPGQPAVLSVSLPEENSARLVILRA